MYAGLPRSVPVNAPPRGTPSPEVAAVSDTNVLFEVEEPPRRSRWVEWLRTGFWPWLGSLKVRVSLCAVVVMLGAMWANGARMGDLAERQLISQAAQREQLHARQLAALIAHRVARLQQVLGVATSGLVVPGRPSMDAAVNALGEQALLGSLFASLAVVEAQSLIERSVPARGAKAGASRPTHDNAALRHALQGLPSVSGATVDPWTGTAAVEFHQPLVDGGQVWAVIIGRMHLTSRDLLADLSEAVDYDETTIVVVSDDRGRILAHPQSAMLGMDVGIDPRLSSAAGRWNRNGRPLLQTPDQTIAASEDLVALAGEAISGWRVWRAVSLDHLLEPMHLARREARLTGSLLALAVALVLVSILAWQLRPLTALERRADQLLRGDDSAAWPEAAGEIGRLAKTLRHVWAERAQADRFTSEILQKLMSVMGAAPVGLAFVRHQRFELVSSECCRLLKFDESELGGQSASQIFASPLDFERLRRAADEAFAAGLSYDGEWRMRASDETTFWARVHARPVQPGDADAGAIWSLYDIEKQVVARQSLEYAAHHDPLSGLLNRTAFLMRAKDVVNARATAQPASLVMIDLDRFKPINDTWGHAAGDAMLRAIASTLEQSVRNTDIVARLGGDEFAVLLPRCSRDQATVVSDKIRISIQSLTVPWNGSVLQVGASLGVSCLHDRHGGVEAWIADADAACYAAKHAGRNAVRFSEDAFGSSPDGPSGANSSDPSSAHPAAVAQPDENPATFDVEGACRSR